ncbi:DUF1707 domain-containing protein [Sphaerisporangium sp. TRM90804]|uniref:DUF1707 SHOCT-like domain-containing protein n=1 Tax=Sphaerisporangium sp. TRM90804 TaxID=3031113 RepID=UPI00244AF2FA|nr:DUF1707 domain-containing protein [Sphaerisporangium sp. TRM90804]MDH2424276.1 DUF1707 domain-containing protein [Sphaerisporangium sp. TRM90804]
MTSRDDLRIGDAEREEVASALREHFAQGRLTHDELDERLGTVLTARVRGELDRVMADLPEQAAARPSHHSERHGGRRHGPGRPAGPMDGGFPGRYPPMPPHADLATWGHHLAARREGPGRRHHRHRPPAPLMIAGVVLVAMLVTGSFWPLFAALKFVFLAWLVIGVLTFARHRHRHHAPHQGFPHRFPHGRRP